MIADSAGNLYGTTEYGGEFGYGTVFEVSASGQEKVLYSFGGPPNDGSEPLAGLTRDAAGNLYGTTSRGGVHDQGTAFELSAQGTETVLHSFFEDRRDGAYPYGGLVLAGGSLYGTTSAGGTRLEGTLFQVSTKGTENVVYSFGGPPDGFGSEAALVMDGAGDLYGTTTNGGTENLGTVFQLGRAGAESVLYSFVGPPDGSNPAAALVHDAAGNLYGTTFAGGSSTPCPTRVSQGCGTVFKVTLEGQETVLYAFTGGADGGVPYASLVIDPKGNLYGTTIHGGSSSFCNPGSQFVGCGVVFGFTASGKERVLHSFGDTVNDGVLPYSGMVFTAGALYGTTYEGGPDGCGTVFKVVP